MSGKRISFKQRIIIQNLIEDYSTKSISEIANATNLTRNTVFREIKNRRILYSSKQRKFLKEEPLKCKLLNQYPFCCNVCPKKEKCAKDVLIYDAYSAEYFYQDNKHECNKGPNITRTQLKELDQKVSPRVFCNQSLFHIIQSDHTIEICEQTLRRYINKGYLSAKSIDLPRTVQRKPTRKKPNAIARVPVNLLYGRMYDDYLLYKNQYQNAYVIQIDLVIGKKFDKTAILTIFEPKTRLQFGIKVFRTSDSINNAISRLLNELKSFNCKTFDAILTDNGAEFKELPLLEISKEGEINFKTFYCNPYASYEKGGCERNHEFFRYIIKKGVSLDDLSQTNINDIFSNINSVKRKILNGESSYNAFKKQYGTKSLEVFGINEIDSKSIILK